MADVIAYIDGFNLYNGLHDTFRHKYLWLDLSKLAQRLRPQDSIVAVRYFTALIRDDAVAEARQRTYLRALKAHTGKKLEITYGRFKTRQQTCRNCGWTRTSYEEKETDVNIAVSLASDAAAGKSDLALLLSADADLCPGIRAARAATEDKSRPFGIVAAFPPRRYSADIKRIVPGAFTISRSDIRNSLLPEVVTDPATGRKYCRPSK